VATDDLEKRLTDLAETVGRLADTTHAGQIAAALAELISIVKDLIEQTPRKNGT
jgi:hypothetical protein